jgi:hypothetical protein
MAYADVGSGRDRSLHACTASKVRASPMAIGRLRKTKKLVVTALLLSVGCASVPEIKEVPGVVLGEPSFFSNDLGAHRRADHSG